MSRPSPSAGDHIDALVSGFAEPLRSRRLLVMFQAYIDDSRRTDPPVFVLAGFVSSASQWKAFSDEWQQVLDLPPRLAYFKMSEAAHLQGQFEDFSETARDERLRHFYRVIGDHALGGLSVVVLHEPYQAAFGGTKYENPYYWALFDLIGQITLHQTNLGATDKIDFIFDRQDPESTLVQGAWAQYERDAPPVVKKFLGGLPIFRDDKEVKPLQAADLYAWWIRRGWYERAGGGEPTRCLRPTIKPMNAVAFVWNEERIKRVQETVGKIDNEV